MKPRYYIVHFYLQFTEIIQTFQTHVIHNQLKRRSEEVQKLTDLLEESSRKETDLQTLLRESKRKFTDLEGKLKEDLMMARIRDTENSQCVAELTQKISNLEFKVTNYQK